MSQEFSVLPFCEDFSTYISQHSEMHFMMFTTDDAANIIFIFCDRIAKHGIICSTEASSVSDI